METRFNNVAVTRDGGHECYDTTITARDIARSFTHGLLRIDPSHQRGTNSITGKIIIKQDKVDRWTRQLQENTAIFGQLTWNFRPEEAKVSFEASSNDKNIGTLILHDGGATIPDSGHRHLAIRAAVESVTSGSSFDPGRRFSLRIWNVSESYEDDIFYAMNMEHDKADATRSKWLAQKNSGQFLARELVRRAPSLGEANVETVSNTLSINNSRLLAFNTLSSGFEDAWQDIPREDLKSATEWLVQFWERLVTVLPDLRELPLAQRQKSRRESLVGWAISIQGYIRLARVLYNQQVDLRLLDLLADDPKFFAWDNPLFRKAGIVVPAITKSGTTKLTVRNSHQSRRGMADVLATKLGLSAEIMHEQTDILETVD